MKRHFFYLNTLILIATFSGLAQKKQAKIVVGQNIIVGTDGNVLHDEHMFSASPKNPDILFGASMKASTGSVAGYLSKDGGITWDNVMQAESGIPEIVLTSDPQAAFSNEGTVYVIAGSMQKNKEGHRVNAAVFYSSTDDGKTWVKSSSENLAGKLEAFDHPQMVVDQTNGKYTGRIYIGTLSEAKNKFPNNKKFSSQYILPLISSDDHGKSFSEPKIAVAGEEGKGVIAEKLLISSKGVLFFTYNEWCRDKSLPNCFDMGRLSLVLSKDGGSTFSPSKKITNDGARQFNFAIDNKSNKFKDRLYWVLSGYRFTVLSKN